jgi:hypothetical protein
VCILFRLPSCQSVLQLLPSAGSAPSKERHNPSPLRCSGAEDNELLDAICAIRSTNYIGSDARSLEWGRIHIQLRR